MRELPQIPIQDVGLGLVSALLLLLAVFLRTRARAFPDGRRELLDARRGPVFRVLDRGGTPRQLSFIASLLLHMLGIAAAPMLPLFLTERLILHEPSPEYELIALDYRIPLPPVVAPSDLPEPAEMERSEPSDTSTEPAEEEEEPVKGEEEGTAGTPEPRPPSAEAGDGAPAALTAQLPPTRPEPPRPAPAPESAVVRLLLPEKLKTDSAEKDIVLQPDFTAPLPEDYVVDLPPVLLWTPESGKLENAAVLEPVKKPVSESARAILPNLEPQLRRPNLEAALADLQIPPAPVLNESPALPVPPADVFPLAGQNPLVVEEVQPPSITGAEGRNSLIALSQTPNIQASTFELLPGLRAGSIESEPFEEVPDPSMGEPAAAGPETPAAEPVSDSAPQSFDPVPDSGPERFDPVPDSGPERFDPVPLRDEDVMIGEGFTEVESYLETPPTLDIESAGLSPLIAKITTLGEGGAKIIEMALAQPQTAADHATGAAGTSPPLEAPSDTADGSGTGENGEGAGAGGDPSGGETGKKRFKPLPRSQYGIILVSNSRSELPEATGVLSGSPVYTVYIDVPQAPRKWILQYCVPKTGRLEVSGGVIRIRRFPRVDPPFVLEPSALPLREAGEDASLAPPRIVVYGVVSEEGRFEPERVIRGLDPETDQMVLAHLRSWEFLPAFQEGVPISVEALIGIPLR